MSNKVSGSWSAALLIASIITSLIAFVAAAGLLGAASAGEMINRVALTIGAMVLATYSYLSALELRRAEQRARSLVPAPVRVGVRR